MLKKFNTALSLAWAAVRTHGLYLWLRDNHDYFW
jgi:hypothetical protein